MKKLIIVVVASIMFFAPISETIAGGAAWHNSQRRTRNAYLKAQKQQSEFWKKFGRQMEPATEPYSCVTLKKNPSRPK